MAADEKLYGYCLFCSDRYDDHPDGKCPLRPGGFVYGGKYKIIVHDGSEQICDTIYQAQLVARQHRGFILDQNGNRVTVR
jgi:hypothetical protein